MKTQDVNWEKVSIVISKDRFQSTGQAPSTCEGKMGKRNVYGGSQDLEFGGRTVSKHVQLIKLHENSPLSLAVLLSFQTRMTVCLATPGVLISRFKVISVANIISWNSLGLVLSKAQKWFSGWDEIRRHWPPPTSICMLHALCSWRKRWCYCFGLIAQWENFLENDEFQYCVINKFQYSMDLFYSVMGEICFLMNFFSFSED